MPAVRQSMLGISPAIAGRMYAGKREAAVVNGAVPDLKAFWLELPASVKQQNQWLEHVSGQDLFEHDLKKIEQLVKDLKPDPYLQSQLFDTILANLTFTLNNNEPPTFRGPSAYNLLRFFAIFLRYVRPNIAEPVHCRKIKELLTNPETAIMVKGCGTPICILPVGLELYPSCLSPEERTALAPCLPSLEPRLVKDLVLDMQRLKEEDTARFREMEDPSKARMEADFRKFDFLQGEFSVCAARSKRIDSAYQKQLMAKMVELAVQEPEGEGLDASSALGVWLQGFPRDVEITVQGQRDFLQALEQEILHQYPDKSERPPVLVDVLAQIEALLAPPQFVELMPKIAPPRTATSLINNVDRTTCFLAAALHLIEDNPALRGRLAVTEKDRADKLAGNGLVYEVKVTLDKLLKKVDRGEAITAPEMTTLHRQAVAAGLVTEDMFNDLKPMQFIQALLLRCEVDVEVDPFIPIHTAEPEKLITLDSLAKLHFDDADTATERAFEEAPPYLMLNQADPQQSYVWPEEFSLMPVQGMGKPPVPYELTKVICYAADVGKVRGESGHYTGFIKKGNDWYKFDDLPAVVKKVKFAEVQAAALKQGSVFSFRQVKKMPAVLAMRQQLRNYKVETTQVGAIGKIAECAGYLNLQERVAAIRLVLITPVTDVSVAAIQARQKIVEDIGQLLPQLEAERDALLMSLMDGDNLRAIKGDEVEGLQSLRELENAIDLLRVTVYDKRVELQEKLRLAQITVEEKELELFRQDTVDEESVELPLSLGATPDDLARIEGRIQAVEEVLEKVRLNEGDEELPVLQARVRRAVEAANVVLLRVSSEAIHQEEEALVAAAAAADVFAPPELPLTMSKALMDRARGVVEWAKRSLVGLDRLIAIEKRVNAGELSRHVLKRNLKEWKAAATQERLTRLEEERKGKAATVIQSSFRRHSAEEKYKKKRTAAVKIQKITREFLARKAVGKIKRAALSVPVPSKPYDPRTPDAIAEERGVVVFKSVALTGKEDSLPLPGDVYPLEEPTSVPVPEEPIVPEEPTSPPVPENPTSPLTPVAPALVPDVLGTDELLPLPGATSQFTAASAEASAETGMLQPSGLVAPSDQRTGPTIEEFLEQSNVRRLVNSTFIFSPADGRITVELTRVGKKEDFYGWANRLLGRTGVERPPDVKKGGRKYFFEEGSSVSVVRIIYCREIRDNLIIEGDNEKVLAELRKAFSLEIDVQSPVSEDDFISRLTPEMLNTIPEEPQAGISASASVTSVPVFLPDESLSLPGAPPPASSSAPSIQLTPSLVLSQTPVSEVLSSSPPASGGNPSIEQVRADEKPAVQPLLMQVDIPEMAVAVKLPQLAAPLLSEQAAAVSVENGNVPLLPAIFSLDASLFNTHYLTQLKADLLQLVANIRQQFKEYVSEVNSKSHQIQIQSLAMLKLRIDIAEKFAFSPKEELAQAKIDYQKSVDSLHLSFEQKRSFVELVEQNCAKLRQELAIDGNLLIVSFSQTNLEEKQKQLVALKEKRDQCQSKIEIATQDIVDVKRLLERPKSAALVQSATPQVSEDENVDAFIRGLNLALTYQPAKPKRLRPASARTTGSVAGRQVKEVSLNVTEDSLRIAETKKQEFETALQTLNEEIRVQEDMVNRLEQGFKNVSKQVKSEVIQAIDSKEEVIDEQKEAQSTEKEELSRQLSALLPAFENAAEQANYGQLAESARALSPLIPNASDDLLVLGVLSDYLKTTPSVIPLDMPEAAHQELDVSLLTTPQAFASVTSSYQHTLDEMHDSVLCADLPADLKNDCLDIVILVRVIHKAELEGDNDTLALRRPTLLSVEKEFKEKLEKYQALLNSSAAKERFLQNIDEFKLAIAQLGIEVINAMPRFTETISLNELRKRFQRLSSLNSHIITLLHPYKTRAIPDSVQIDDVIDEVCDFQQELIAVNRQYPQVNIVTLFDQLERFKHLFTMLKAKGQNTLLKINPLQNNFEANSEAKVMKQQLFDDLWQKDRSQLFYLLTEHVSLEVPVIYDFLTEEQFNRFRDNLSEMNTKYQYNDSRFLFELTTDNKIKCTRLKYNKDDFVPRFIEWKYKRLNTIPDPSASSSQSNPRVVSMTTDKPYIEARCLEAYKIAVTYSSKEAQQLFTRFLGVFLNEHASDGDVDALSMEKKLKIFNDYVFSLMSLITDPIIKEAVYTYIAEQYRLLGQRCIIKPSEAAPLYLSIAVNIPLRDREIFRGVLQAKFPEDRDKLFIREGDIVIPAPKALTLGTVKEVGSYTAIASYPCGDNPRILLVNPGDTLEFVRQVPVAEGSLDSSPDWGVFSKMDGLNRVEGLYPYKLVVSY